MTIFSETDRIFFSDGYLLAREVFQKEVIPGSFIELMEKFYGQVDGLNSSFVNRCEREGKNIDCHRGCSWCCHQAVLAGTHEMLYLCSYLREHLDQGEIDKILMRAGKKNEITGKMKASEFLHFKHPCPLLEEGACMAYPARPLACRTYLSSNVDSCLQEYRHPRNHLSFPALYAFPLQSGRMMNEGISLFLRENKLHVAEFLLESKLGEILRTPDTLLLWTTGMNLNQQNEIGQEDMEYIVNHLGRK